MKDITLLYKAKFESLLKLQDQVKHIHPLLQEHYPIAIVEEGNFYIFEYLQSGYELTKVEPDTMHIPHGIRAAFPLESLQYQVAVVVTGEVFDSVDEQVIIFHEFVHCYQFQTCEMSIRENIGLAQRALQSGDYSWELHYPFPYTDQQFTQWTRTLFDGIAKKDNEQIATSRIRLKACLTAEQIEYMVWQEWKEGFARYIENRIKKQLGIELNHGGSKEPFSRTTFYEMGSQLIELIVEASPSAHNAIEELYYALNSDQYFKVK